MTCKKIAVLVLFFTSFSIYLFSQKQIGIGYTQFVSRALSDDNGIHLSWQDDVQASSSYFEIEYRSIDWGNVLNLNGGYSILHKSTEKWQFRSLPKVHLGLALFHDAFKPTIGLSYQPTFTWYFNRRLYTTAGLGLQYSICPGYRDYGNSDQWDLPLFIQFGYRLKGKN